MATARRGSVATQVGWLQRRGRCPIEVTARRRYTCSSTPKYLVVSPTQCMPLLRTVAAARALPGRTTAKISWTFLLNAQLASAWVVSVA